MKRIIISFLFIIMISADGRSEQFFGKMIEVKGTVDLTDIMTGRISLCSTGTQFGTNHRIRTANNSYAEIVLNEGTKVFVYAGSVIRVVELRLKKSDSPTRLNILTGEVKINVSRPMKGRTLIAETPTALTGVGEDETDFGIIAARFETRVVVFDGNLDVASANRMVPKSFNLVKREETVVPMDQPPGEPLTLPPDIAGSWFEYYEIAGGDKIKIKGKTEDGIIGHILKKREF